MHIIDLEKLRRGSFSCLYMEALVDFESSHTSLVMSLKLKYINSV